MQWIEALQAAFLGIVEGLTEFLPVSSTGHLIIAGDLIGFHTGPSADTFYIAIQAGAIVAVCWHYRERIFAILRNLFVPGKEQRLAVNTVIAFIPAAFLGVLLSSTIKAYLFNPAAVAAALIVGGILILWIERAHEKSGKPLGCNDYRGTCFGALAQGCNGILVFPCDPDDFRRNGLRPL